jgi:hypothetical protein
MLSDHLFRRFLTLQLKREKERERVRLGENEKVRETVVFCTVGLGNDRVTHKRFSVTF